MSHHQSASSTQAAIALNPQALLNAIHWLERAKQHTSDLVDVFATHENDLKLVEIEIEITTALMVLSKAVMQGEPLTPPAKTSPEEQATTPPQRQTTTYCYSKDPRGYDIRILCDAFGCSVRVNPSNNSPAGHEQVCLCCGNRDFVAGSTVCPDCDTEVKYRCRYVSITGGV